MVKRPTINDVAARAGVSRATVSLVVRDSPQIPEVTKSRVRAAIDEIGYVYNRRAAEMRSLTSRIIGLVVTNVRNPYFAELTMAIEEAAAAAGYTVLFACSSDDTLRQAHVLRAMVEHQVDGVIMLPANRTDAASLRAVLGSPGLPNVLVAREIGGYDAHYVGADNETSGRLAGQHLRDLGARDVAFVGGVEGSAPRADRRRGLLAGLAPAVGALVADVPSPSDGVEDLAPSLARAFSHGVPDAVVAYNDMYGIAVVGALRSLGLEPGRQVAVASFDDVPAAAQTYPSLTSAAGFPERVGASATALLLADIRERSVTFERRLIEPALHARQSTLMWAGTRATGSEPQPRTAPTRRRRGAPP